MKQKILVAGLILGLSLLAIAAPAAQDKQQAPDKQSGPGLGTRSPLDLTPEQQARFEALRKATWEQRQARRDEMNKMRDELRALQSEAQADPKRVEALIDRISKLRADRMKSAFQHRREMENILTPQQREKMAAFRGRVRGLRAAGCEYGLRLGRRAAAPGLNQRLNRGSSPVFLRGFERGRGRSMRRPGLYPRRHHYLRFGFQPGWWCQ